MPLMDDLDAEYRRRHPHRQGRPAQYPDWLPAFLAVVERKLASKADRHRTGDRLGAHASDE